MKNGSKRWLLLFMAAAIVSCSDNRPVTDGELALEAFDIIIEGGLVYDGLGNDPIQTDVGIVAERIVQVGPIPGSASGMRIDATGMVVAPGFIDIHSHATSTSIEGSGIVQRPDAENYIRQGVTTAMGGQDGGSPLDIGGFLSALDSIPKAINIGVFIGHGSIRSHIIGDDDRVATPDELSRMTHLVSQGMRDGAFGLSSGLEYVPAVYADNSELITIAKPAAEAGGLYISHIRDEGALLLASVAEVIAVAENTGISAQITHHKVIGKDRWGGSEASLGLIDEARAKGLDIRSDVYPYTASSTGMTILFPAWAKEDGNDALLRRLRDPEQRGRIRADVIDHINRERGADPYTIVAARCSDFPEVDGLSLGDILEERNMLVDVEHAADVAIELIEKGGCSGVFHSMSEDDVRLIMRHEYTMISSDGGIPSPGVGVPHPRNYGAFARVLGRYVRQWNVLSMKDAIYKMSGLPAQTLGLDDRGVLRAGAAADVTVFDPGTIVDRAEFGDPHHYATGVRDVLVNGRVVLADGVMTGERPGTALRHRGSAGVQE